jgi:hypothetical protein
MGEPSEGPDSALIGYLESRGFVLVRRGAGEDYVVRTADGEGFAYEPVLYLPTALLAEYLEVMSRTVGDVPDAYAEALSLTQIHLEEELATDHGLGTNYVRALGFRRRRGRVEFFVEQDLPDVPYVPPDPDLRWTAERP